MKETYAITIKRSFSAAHVLRDIGGKCEDLHGHNFTVEVTAEGNKLNNEDLLLDFRDLKQWTDEVLADLDHRHLNDLACFEGMNPSSERVAKYIYDRLAPRAAAMGLRLQGVTVWESDSARATYTRQDDD
ncbi:MAG: 6-carboxytetrahydropterin synthase QueD [Syntrophales bacterium]|nr:6-carboxytetrahydropterin synthase QueD [Syntrophales bacterium]